MAAGGDGGGRRWPADWIYETAIGSGATESVAALLPLLCKIKIKIKDNGFQSVIGKSRCIYSVDDHLVVIMAALSFSLTAVNDHGYG